MKLKENKTLKVGIISSLITAIIFSGIAVVAVTLSAEDIIFTSTHEEWQVDNAKDALDTLFTKSTEIVDARTVDLKIFNTKRVDYSNTSLTISLAPGKYLITTGVGNGGTYKLTIQGADEIFQLTKNGSAVNKLVTSPITFTSTSEPNLRISGTSEITVKLAQTSGESGNYSTFNITGFNY